ncbi:unnamed protein product, partial [Prorocentrum cordatum]
MAAVAAAAPGARVAMGRGQAAPADAQHLGMGSDLCGLDSDEDGGSAEQGPSDEEGGTAAQEHLEEGGSDVDWSLSVKEEIEAASDNEIVGADPGELEAAEQADEAGHIPVEQATPREQAQSASPCASIQLVPKAAPSKRSVQHAALDEQSLAPPLVTPTKRPKIKSKSPSEECYQGYTPTPITMLTPPQ